MFGLSDYLREISIGKSYKRFYGNEGVGKDGFFLRLKNFGRYFFWG